MMQPVVVKDLTLPELANWIESIGERRFRARQLFRHIYARRVRSWQECSDLSKLFRVQLEFGTCLDALKLIEQQTAADGTRKYLFELHDGHCIESVLIPDPPRQTLCLSSQVGCAMGCRFCVTGSMGFKRNLSVGEIVDQICQVQRDQSRITNLVFMGMGEPLANHESVCKAMQIMLDPNGMAFSHRRITLSTAGLIPQLRRLGEESPVNLAISLHAADDALRSHLMPINKTYPLEQLMAACREYPLPPRKRITFEYILMDRVNDEPGHARKLIKLLHGVRAKVNLIPFNPHPGIPYGQSPAQRILEFQEILQKAQLNTLIRQSRGSDIFAACGQLAAQYSLRQTAKA